MTSRIVLLHATPVAMQPIHSAFAEVWPEAQTINLLDDGLTIDRARENELSESLIERFVRFGRYGYDMGADAILITCSAFGPAIDRLAAELPVPVLKPNEAMFQAAVSYGLRIGMLATFGPAVVTMTEDWQQGRTEDGIGRRSHR
jgi:Asp/Glu/hydantoin racemase